MPKSHVKDEKKEEPKAPDIAEIKKELEDSKELAENYYDRLLRLQAEFDNYKKQMIKEREETVKYSNEKLVLQLLPVYESLENGVQSAKNNDTNDALFKGIELVYQQFNDILEKNGLKPIKALGEKFDPYRHEALMQTVDGSLEDDTILEEFQKGYSLNNKVIRCSKVRVSKKQ